MRKLEITHKLIYALSMKQIKDLSDSQGVNISSTNIQFVKHTESRVLLDV